jgi:uncharacterized protein
MSFLTDRARAAARTPTCSDAAPCAKQRFETLLDDPRVPRRMMLCGGFAGSLATLLAACGGGSGAVDTALSASTPGVDQATKPMGVETLAVGFTPVVESKADAVTVPEGYRTQRLFSAGDAVERDATPYDGTYPSSAQAEKFAGNHDGMHFYPLPGLDANRAGLLAINHEYPDFAILMSGTYDANDSSAAGLERKRLALSAVGVSVIEVRKQGSEWQLRPNSRFNRRYSGNTLYRVSGPAAAAVGPAVVGTLNNCASGATPWGTYLTCEETTDNYLDPTQNPLGYGWVVEIDPYGQLANMPVKRTALGRFDHENTAYRLGSDNTVAIYMGDDSTPGCIYKFVPTGKVHRGQRAANAELLDSGTLYAARFAADGSGAWIELTQGKNGLVAGAIDPGNVTQGPQTPTTVDFLTQADVLIDTKAAARVAGATLMDRPEWIAVAPDRSVFVTLTNNSGRKVIDAANPRVENRHGHIVRWREAGDAPDAMTFRWELVVQAGDPALANATGNLVGNLVGDTFSSPDGIGVDPAGRLWVQTDMSLPGTSGISGVSNVDTFGNNAMYALDAASRASKRFLVGPVGCEITGLAWTPDLKTFFVNIQHPSQAWPSNVQGNTLPPRSSTIIVQRADGGVVGS